MLFPEYRIAAIEQMKALGYAMSGFTFIIEKSDPKEIEFLHRTFTVHDDYWYGGRDGTPALEFAAIGSMMGLWGHNGRSIESDTQRCEAIHALMQRLKDVPVEAIEAAFPTEGEKPKAVAKRRAS